MGAGKQAAPPEEQPILITAGTSLQPWYFLFFMITLLTDFSLFFFSFFSFLNGVTEFIISICDIVQDDPELLILLPRFGDYRHDFTFS